MAKSCMKVNGAGFGAVNGLYKRRADRLFQHVTADFQLRQGVDLSTALGAGYKSTWVVETNGIHFYVCKEGEAGTQGGAWEAVAGKEPAPTVSEADADESKQAENAHQPLVLIPTGPVENFARKYHRRQTVAEILHLGRAMIGKKLTVKAYAQHWRPQKAQFFAMLNDGSCLDGLQCCAKYDELEGLADGAESKKHIDAGSRGASLEVTGTIIESQGKGQEIELQIEKFVVVGPITDLASYPMAAKRAVKMDVMRGPDFCHLRVRSKKHRTVQTIRNTLASATHEFFQNLGLKYVHTPCLTANDCEGAGETFVVSNMMTKDTADIPVKEGTTHTDFSKDFFGTEVNLTVSGQLHVEAMGAGLGDVYTFGPTFRAEKSNTSRHLAEFWMIEPEIYFCTLQDNMNLAEDYLKFCIAACLKRHPAEMAYLNKEAEDSQTSSDLPQLDDGPKKPRVEILRDLLNVDFKRVTYTEGVNQLMKRIESYEIVVQPENWGEMSAKDQKKWKKSNRKAKHIFENPVYWGVDLASEHEKFLTEHVYKCPIFLYNYPKKIKSFYMKENDDPIEKRTVQAMDMLVPGIGELIGGSAREDDEQKLIGRCEEKGINPKDLQWYIDLRKYGSTPHAGFGLGFGRLIMLCTGIENIKDVIPFPRAHRECCF